MGSRGWGVGSVVVCEGRFLVMLRVNILGGSFVPVFFFLGGGGDGLCLCVFDCAAGSGWLVLR